MSEKYIIALDLGTTGNRVFCFNELGVPVASSYKEFEQIFPEPGWVEHDPLVIWNSVLSLIKETIDKAHIKSENIISIGITNQRETALLWNKETGTPIHNAIVWQCRRTRNICESLKEEGHEKLFREKTGLVVDAYFSGTKIKWLIDTIPGVKEAIASGKILFGTIDTWILWKLTDGKSHKTDYTNASRTLIFDIVKKEWSDELLEVLNISKTILPEVCDSASHFGETKNVPGLPDGIVIGGIAGDQQAAMVGQNCVFKGTSKNTYGTGCFLLCNTGDDFFLSKNGLLTTLACDNKGKSVYALEGAIFIGGAVVQWLRDYMRFFKESSESEPMARSIHKRSEVVFVPAFVGLGAPYWKMDAKGAIFGIARDTSREEIVLAAIKSIALQTKDVVDVMEADAKISIDQLKVDGGATQNKFLMQFQADILKKTVVLPENTESTALGAAYLAGLTAGLYNSIDEIAQNNKILHLFTPQFSEEDKEYELNLWSDAIKRLL